LDTEIPTGIIPVSTHGEVLSVENIVNRGAYIEIYASPDENLSGDSRIPAWYFVLTAEERDALIEALEATRA
jgi:hypothetical protein